jgi:hypothetical protein
LDHDSLEPDVEVDVDWVGLLSRRWLRQEVLVEPAPGEFAGARIRAFDSNLMLMRRAANRGAGYPRRRDRLDPGLQRILRLCVFRLAEAPGHRFGLAFNCGPIGHL